ncbi:MAG: hypothetical protein V3S37_05630, partial [Dehalococcoidia bacterium]
ESKKGYQLQETGEVRAQKPTVLGMRDLLICLECGRRFFGKNTTNHHRCRGCSSIAIVTQADLRLAGLALKPIMNAWLLRSTSRVPPRPLPWEINGLTVYVAALFSVASKARTPERRQRVIELMLIEIGFPEGQARDFTSQMVTA